MSMTDLGSLQKFYDSFLFFLAKSDQKTGTYIGVEKYIIKIFTVITPAIYTYFVLDDDQILRFNLSFENSCLSLLSFKRTSSITIKRRQVQDSLFKGESKSHIDSIATFCDYLTVNQFLQTHLASFLSLYNIQLKVDNSVSTTHYNSLIYTFRSYLPRRYKVPPHPIIKEKITLKFYELFKQGQFTDLTIISSHQTFYVHLNLFYINGGEYMRTLLTSDFREKHQSSINFTNFDTIYVRQYIDFVYLNQQATVDTDINNLLEVYKFAHYLQFEKFQVHLENLINYHCTLADIPIISQYAQFYKDLNYIVQTSI